MSDSAKVVIFGIVGLVALALIYLVSADYSRTDTIYINNSDCCCYTGGPSATSTPTPTATVAPTNVCAPLEQSPTPEVPTPTETQPVQPTSTVPVVDTPGPSPTAKVACNRGVGNSGNNCDPGNSPGQGRGGGRPAGEDRDENDTGPGNSGSNGNQNDRNK